MSASIDIADAVVSVINGGTYARPFTAVRGYVPQFVLEDAVPQGTQVFVAPATHGVESMTRGTKRHVVSLVVSVIEKTIDITNAAIDPLIEIVETIKLLLSGTIAVGSARALASIGAEPLYRTEILHEQRLFWSLFTITLQLPDDYP